MVESLPAEIAHARGSIARPLSDRELEAKLRELAAYGAPGIDAERLIEAAWAIEAEETVRNVLVSSRAGTGPA